MTSTAGAAFLGLGLGLFLFGHSLPLSLQSQLASPLVCLGVNWSLLFSFESGCAGYLVHYGGALEVFSVLMGVALLRSPQAPVIVYRKVTKRGGSHD